MASIPGAIAQSRLSGREFTADALVDRDGRLLTCVPRWRVETKAGISVKGSTFESEEVTQLVADALAAVGLTGPANVQGFVDADGAATIDRDQPPLLGRPAADAGRRSRRGRRLPGGDLSSPTSRSRPSPSRRACRCCATSPRSSRTPTTGRRLRRPGQPTATVRSTSAPLEPVDVPVGDAGEGAGPAAAASRASGDVRRMTVYQRRLGVLAHAVLGNNVTETCRVFGISRSTFYRWRSKRPVTASTPSPLTSPAAPLEPVA